MKRQDQLNQEPSDTETKKSCPAVIQEDVTRSINQQCIFYPLSFIVGRNIRSQQFLPHYEDYVIQNNDTLKRQSVISALKSSGFGQKLEQEPKINPRINQKGTDFGCEKVESIQLSQDDASYRSGSLGYRSNPNSQQQLGEPLSVRKFKKQEKQKSSNIKSYRQNDIKQEVLNVLLAGAQNTGKSTFKQCFKGKQRKPDEFHIKSRTQEIKYEKMVDQNLLNKRNNICFIDLPGFTCNQEDKYLRQIQQYATAQWRNFEVKPDEDKRIHCCLYFMRGPRIKNSDINVMKKLSQIFNIIPVIAKSDHYKKEQILEMKEDFNKKIAAVGQIEFYDLQQFFLLKFGTERINEALYSNFGKLPPFAIATSTDRLSPQPSYFVRNYPWGKIEIQNEQHTDFKRLYDLLISDVRAQFVAKMIDLIRRDKSENVQEVMGEIQNESKDQSNERNENKCFLGQLKNFLVITTLVGAVGGVLLFPRLREEIIPLLKSSSN